MHCAHVGPPGKGFVAPRIIDLLASVGRLGSFFRKKDILKICLNSGRRKLFCFRRDKNDFEQGVNTSRADGINFLKICVN